VVCFLVGVNGGYLCLCFLGVVFNVERASGPEGKRYFCCGCALVKGGGQGDPVMTGFQNVIRAVNWGAPIGGVFVVVF